MKVISFILIASVIVSVLADQTSRKRDLADVIAGLSQEDLQILNQFLTDFVNICAPQLPQMPTISMQLPSKFIKFI